MADKLVSLAEAVALVPDGCAVGTGGVLNSRRPVALAAAVARAGRRDLTLWTMLGALDVELLAAHDALAAVGSIYVGFEGLGPAPAYEAAVAAGRVTAMEHSELTLVGGLRAALAGLPFFPTRGATGSDVAARLGLKEVADPYTGERLIAAPAIRPDVALVHAEAATADVTVIAPSGGDFLVDYDANVARASARVVVSVERIAEVAEARERGALLHAGEVTAVVLAPGGARPTGLPGVHGPDLGRLGTYLQAAAADPAGARDALEALLA